MSCSLTLELRGVITSLEGLFPRGAARRLPSSGVSGRNARGVQLGNLLERKTFDLSVVCSGLAVDSSRGGEVEFVLELASGMKKYTYTKANVKTPAKIVCEAGKQKSQWRRLLGGSKQLDVLRLEDQWNPKSRARNTPKGSSRA